MTQPDPTREILKPLDQTGPDLTRPDPGDFGNLLTRPNPTREILKRNDPTRPDPRGFETSLTRPAGRVMTREKPWNFAVAYFLPFVSLLTSAGLERLFVLTSAGLERMKHVNVFRGRLQRPSPLRVRRAPRHERGWMVSEIREKLPKYCILRR